MLPVVLNLNDSMSGSIVRGCTWNILFTNAHFWLMIVIGVFMAALPLYAVSRIEAILVWPKFRAQI